MYLLYDILLLLAYIVYLPVYALRGRLHPQILVRAGFYKKEIFSALRAKDTVWIHAESVGEARAA
ncbi:MAG TPA: 3-deoxy-D-manno-octulosonic acid transferase, partial [Candidatus Omnitrophota bacterium]|nr:3-deoxy-D-manno-octulosonic acid transferase [Candidatus Omnitrophota bacterium]